ncbi:NAD(P)/FAD-dependent oxidoreductase, partial [Klebsiella pneumoniae]|uniref:NAD(P)/FAD-dependent oxidoreductase n=1 Tax=Klebsiella pneumoniae TaxID=573 RepID=UPI00216145F8
VRGISCAIVELADRICPLPLDAVAAKPYQELFSKAGCPFYLAEKAAGSEIDAQGNIVSLSLESGTVLPCDFVVVAAGVRPAIGFLEGSGL